MRIQHQHPVGEIFKVRVQQGHFCCCLPFCGVDVTCPGLCPLENFGSFDGCLDCSG